MAVQKRQNTIRAWVAIWRLARRSAGIGLVCTACGISDEGTLPPDVQDPATLKTPSGAIARYRGALGVLPGVFDRVMIIGGILTDELTAMPTSIGTSGLYTNLDSRIDLSSYGRLPASRLHYLRGQAREARGFLSAFAPDSSPALQGHLFALEAYADVFLADLFCSGIPLSTVDFDGTYTLAEGSTTAEVYRQAVELFDNALTLTDDSVRFQHLAAVGKGRALLAMGGEYAAAADAVSGVPDNYRYETVFSYSGFLANAVPDSARFWFFAQSFGSELAAPTVANQEGATGLNYRLSGDPRTSTDSLGRNSGGNSFFFPQRYPRTGPVTFTLASGIEARLIEAEAALQADDDGGTWLTLLNHLRQIAWSSIVTRPPLSGPLPDLADPGTNGPGIDASRVDLLFRERAFWLYLTAHRQGDLRRLIRQYLRMPETVYPTGAYQGGGGVYGNKLVVPVPEVERTINPKYTGCFHENA